MSEIGLSVESAEHEAATPISEAPEIEETHGKIALSLSGGGYRAMLFHLGVLWRLNDGGWLPRIDTIASVSGGSMAAAILGVNWTRIEFDPQSRVAKNFESAVAEPMFELAAVSLAGRVRMTLRFLNVFKRTSKSVADQLDKVILKGAQFSSLPLEGPSFIFKATSLHDGNLWVFMRERMGDYKSGYIEDHGVRLADAVVSSAAFPPFVSPFQLQLDRKLFKKGRVGPPGSGEKVAIQLTDGGVYDNLGLERAFKNHKHLFVSDASGVMERKSKVARNWLGHMLRVTSVINNQVRSLRRRQLIASFAQPVESGGRAGAYWSTSSDPSNYPESNTLVPVSDRVRRHLSEINTDLRPLSDDDRRKLVNWGYVITDIAINSWVTGEDAALSKAVPFPDTKLAD